MAELLPCPFCGGNVRIWHNLETENYDIECQKCGCDVQQHYGCKDEAITAWNTRTPKETHEKHTATHDNTPKERGGEK